MAKELNEIDSIFEHIKNGENFLLSGGAGSGKTYSLVKVIEKIFKEDPRSKVRCITYTNVAVDEIKSRLEYSTLKVSTIHDFLWECIKPYQKNLRASLIDLLNADEIKHSFKEKLENDFFNDKEIQYKEWTALTEGIISHDDVLKLGLLMFQKFPMLARIVKDKFNFILIDEYQDTAPELITILLDLMPQAGKQCIVGFFGDAMQSIYDHGTGTIQKYIDTRIVREVIKKDNRRNPVAVIKLANQLRNDSVTQEAVNDNLAPNYHVSGDIKFFYSQTTTIEAVKQHEHFRNWNFENSLETKELYLTHNLIASKAKFELLIEIYDKERIVEYKKAVKDAVAVSNIDTTGKTFGEVIDMVNVRASRPQQDFFAEHPQLVNKARAYPWEIFSKIYLNKDQLLGAKRGSGEDESKKGSQRDALISHLFHLQDCIHLYRSGNYRKFIQKADLKIDSILAKQVLKESIDQLSQMHNNSIGEVIELADKLGVFKKTEKLFRFISEKEYVYDRVKAIGYQQFINVYNYVEEYTPFSTQHNVKGTEFDNVLVVLDNGKWNKYDFEKLFLNSGTASVLERTRKIFYVCCTRTKKNLAVYYYNPTAAVVSKAREWFGAENVICTS